MPRSTTDPAGVAPPPAAARRPRRSTHHGITRTDDYAWLRDARWQEVMRAPETLAPGIRAHLDAENSYTAAVLEEAQEQQRILFAEMRARIKEDDVSVPAADGPWLYYVRQVKDGQHPVFCRRPGETDAPETLLLDGNAEAAASATSGAGDYFRLGGWAHSPDHTLLAWSADRRGAEYYDLHLRQAGGGPGETIADTIADTTGEAVWSADSRWVFYVQLDAHHRPSRVLRHKVGAPPLHDTLVHEEKDPGFFVSLDKTQSGDFILIEAHDHTTSEVWLVDARAPTAAPRLVAARCGGVEYHLDHDRAGARFLIRTNAGGAEDFRIVEAPVANPAPAAWRDVVAHAPGSLLLSHVCYRDHLARLVRKDGVAHLVVRALQSGAEHTVAFPGSAHDLALLPGYAYDTGVLRFTYSSMSQPLQVHDYDMARRTGVLRKTDDIPSGHDPAHYVTRRLHAPAADGQLVPVSVLHHRDTALDGSAPVLLYGYGSYGVTVPAAFSASRLSLVDRGFVYAIAHVRGGKARGWRWYADGRGARKINTFTDFIAAGEHLAAAGITARGRITGHGGSAGGLLMGAAANMAPDLFCGIIAEVPFVDVLATMLDGSLPLTPPEWPEWGNPAADPEAYRTIASWSPVDNVRARAYPHILATAGLADPRVTYWEPARWMARLRAMNTSKSLLLLKTNMEAGHGGAAGRFARLEDVAFLYAFALMIHGRLDPASPGGSPEARP